MAFDPVAARAKLKAKIAEQDAARGRPLTDTEKLAHLKKALDEISLDEAKSLRDALDEKIAGF